MASKKLLIEFQKYLKILRSKFKNNQMPATAIGVEYRDTTKKDFSGPHPPEQAIAPVLLKQFNKMGGLGKKVNGNRLGCCCEVRSANKILGSRSSVPVSKLLFTKAIRPRTGQKVARCPNCVQVFGDE